eukprot:TRINITY_DN30454_c0_g1_i3.p1 TRINITY_DN30454_c0_g1~~TRINITY_DN30454_c0_g1_i3.p1  ORF type:complete len:841 (+),score=162.46 TRINITY_DN30454_c0_g1_i3:53-2575(+)
MFGDDGLEHKNAKSELVSRLSAVLGRSATGNDMVYRVETNSAGLYVCELTLHTGAVHVGEASVVKKKAEQSAALVAARSLSVASSSVSLTVEKLVGGVQARSSDAEDKSSAGPAPAKKPRLTSPEVRMCGPANIQTLRGTLFGRQVALVCCGEAHEEVIDLTREGCVIEPKRGWVKDESFGPHACMDKVLSAAAKSRTTLAEGMRWAEKIIKNDREESAWHDAWLSFETTNARDGTGTARVFASDAASRYNGVTAATESTAMQLFRWSDLDTDARELARRRGAGKQVTLEELDDMVARRKAARRAEGLLMFDDWLAERAGKKEGDGEGNGSKPYVALVLEAPVKASEVELHVDPAFGPAPVAAACHRLVEPDSDTDSEDDEDLQDGTGSYLAYLERQARTLLSPDQFRCVDPRELGDAGDERSRWLSFQELLPAEEKTIPDLEEGELDASGAVEAISSSSSGCSQRPRHVRAKARRPIHHDTDVAKEEAVDSKAEEGAALAPIPSWEAFFGAAAELLYYSPHVKADYAHFLTSCVRTADNMRKFFMALFFGTVPEALSFLQLDETTRPFARVRSLVYQAHSGAALQRRSSDYGLIPVRTAPLDRYLKAKGFDPPRLWVSGLAERLMGVPGGSSIVEDAKNWYLNSTNHLLKNPRDSDASGDYFIAWLRACHRGVFRDIDRSDPEKLRKQTTASSEARPDSFLHRFDLTQVRIPSLDAGFLQLQKSLSDPSARSCTAQERTLAQILVDGFQLRLVDLAAILSVADVVQSAPAGDQPVVVVIYAGGDHTRSVVEFWESKGFSSQGLPGGGYLGKEDWEDEHPRGLVLPEYLKDFSELFQSAS